ncbi:ABC transporter substrate-binding protein [Arthrobacter glacialis]|uniref:Sugar ABC transporter substrate-binding protein n=1 Tax=Arthrobacter glacialis TaxID=1664 RepID=A0A2S3ZVJ7_ARTGL|nr:extracellular solute-binding protein [Arthrobacter glacialis]POH73119.1 hypothetical protein CVS27_11325 [Arthrobacter glacialis]
MRRRELIVAGAAILAGGLTACVPTASANGRGGDSVLTISTWTAKEPGLKDWWPQLIAGFEAEHGGVTVRLREIAYADYQQQITTQLMAGAAPDVVHVPTPTTTLPVWAEAGFLLDMDDFLAGTDILGSWPSTQKVMAWGGRNYGVLLVDYGYVMFYNEAVLAAAGVSVPETPEELLLAAQRVAALSGDVKPFAIAADNSANFIRDALVFTTGMDAQWASDGKWAFSDPGVVKALDLWRTLGRDYAPQGTDIAQKREAFLTGNVAMMIEGPFYQATVKKTASASLVDSLQIAKTPFAISPGDVSHGFSVPQGLDATKEALALDFVKFATSMPMMEAYSQLVGSPVTRPGAAAALLDDEQRAVMANVAENMTPIIDPSMEGLRLHYFDFTQIAGTSFHKLLMGTDDTGTILAELQSELEKAGITP